MESISRSAISMLPLSFAVQSQISSRSPPPRVPGDDSSGPGCLRRCDACSTALFHVIGELPHALLRDRPTQAARERCFGRVHCGEYRESDCEIERGGNSEKPAGLNGHAAALPKAAPILPAQSARARSVTRKRRRP